MGKKFLSKPMAILLCAVMLMTCIPVTAFAVETAGTAEMRTETSADILSEVQENDIDISDEDKDTYRPEEPGESGDTDTHKGSGGSGAPAFTDEPEALGSAESPISDGEWVYSEGAWKYMINGSPLINTVAWISYKGSDNKIYTGYFIFGRNGEMLTGWQEINGAWYYFSTIPGITYGMMMTGTVTPDGYTVGADGKCTG